MTGNSLLPADTVKTVSTCMPYIALVSVYLQNSVAFEGHFISIFSFYRLDATVILLKESLVRSILVILANPIGTRASPEQPLACGALTECYSCNKPHFHHRLPSSLGELLDSQ